MTAEARMNGSFGEFLRARRRAVGLSQEELAERSELSVRSVSDLERGRTAHPHPRSARMLADALGLTSPDRETFLAVAATGSCPGPETAELAAIAAAPTAARAAVPRQLPVDVCHFTGRVKELLVLKAWADVTPGGDAPRVMVISGTAGVGKTALAVRWAHQTTSLFPDGQLYVNLRGHHPGRRMQAADALAAFLRALGVHGQDIPENEAERAARYRSLLAGRRMLVIADNALEVGQVRPLIPGDAACKMVVTSRDMLAGLVARDGAGRMELRALSTTDAVRLLRTTIGKQADADPGATVALTRQCCRLPLALRIAAELALARPERSVKELVGELTDQGRRLERLATDGDPDTTLRTVFSWSYRYLDSATARTFRLFGLHPGSDVDAYAVAALNDIGLTQCRRTLDLLIRAHLIEAAGQDRFAMHDLLRSYARKLADADGDAAQHAALTRLFDYYLQTAGAAIDTLFPAYRHRRTPISAPGIAAMPTVNTPATARAWLDAQRPNLVMVVAHTAAHGWPEHAIRMAAVLFPYLYFGGHHPEALIIHGNARRAARETGDSGAEAAELNSLGEAAMLKGRWQQAIGYFRQSLALAREADDGARQADALGNIGVIRCTHGRYQLAIDHYQRSLTLFRRTNDRPGMALALARLAVVDLRQGRYEQAAGRLRESLALSREAGDRCGEASALTVLGEVALRTCHYREARTFLRQSLSITHDTGDRSIETRALVGLGEAGLRLGSYPEAARHYRQCLVLSRNTGDRPREAEALCGLGEVHLAAGQPDLARTQLARAIRLASDGGNRYAEARARAALGRSYAADGAAEDACRLWREALASFESLGAPEAREVRALLVTSRATGNTASYD
jgi:tetratricopeptide (TPR) repeat protein/transcriptional regulator with XRE-family HTH domain